MNAQIPSKKRTVFCRAKTAEGKPCRNRILKGRDYCHYHQQPPCTIAAVVSYPAAQPTELLEEALEKTAFWGLIESARVNSKKRKTAFSIVIIPDLEHFSAGSSRGTDPRLVEHLITLLHRCGYTSVAVVDGPGYAAAWLDNRDVAVLADLAGYRYITEDGGSYDVLDLSEDCVDAGFKLGTALAGTRLSRHWLEADFRICFGKNKTHEEEFFSLCLHTLMGVFPFRDKSYHCHSRLPAHEILAELLAQTPVHFSLIDAVESNHGSDGIRKNTLLPTHTVIASSSILLTDMTGALKMGVDPYASSLNRYALRTLGLPSPYRIDGDLTPYAGWKNIPPILVDSVRKRNRNSLLRRATQPWSHSVDTLYFPFKREIDERINKTIAPLLSGLDDHPFKLLAMIVINYLLANSSRFLDIYRILYDKEKIYRKITSIGIDPKAYTDADYDSIEPYITAFEAITAYSPPDRNGLRWRTIDSSVVMEYRHILPFQFKDFVSHVDIATAVRTMNDNIGGAVMPILVQNGQVLRQIERDIYLPQPNWMAFFDGDFIDVTKLETMHRSANEHAIFWKTVASVNNSGRFDDGMVRFSRASDSTTSVVIVVRQDFTLPLIWQFFNMDLLPHIKNPLVSDAYLTYFGRTIANYEAVYQGRDVKTGREFASDYGESDSITPESVIDVLFSKLTAIGPIADIVKAVLEKGPKALTEINPTTGEAVSMLSSAISAVADIMKDLIDAMRKDLTSSSDPGNKDGL